MKFTSILLISAVSAIRHKLADGQEPAFHVEVKSMGNHPNNICKDGDTATVNYTGKLTNG